MLDIKIDTSALDKLLTKFPSECNRAIDLSLQQSALLVQNQAKVNAPYKTGNLRRSITNVVKKGIAQVGSDVEYAKVREYFTRRLPHGYLRPAITSNAKKIQNIFQQNIKNLIRKLT